MQPRKRQRSEPTEVTTSRSTRSLTIKIEETEEKNIERSFRKPEKPYRTTAVIKKEIDLRSVEDKLYQKYERAAKRQVIDLTEEEGHKQYEAEIREQARAADIKKIESVIENIKNNIPMPQEQCTKFEVTPAQLLEYREISAIPSVKRFFNITTAAASTSTQTTTTQQTAIPPQSDSTESQPTRPGL